MDTNLIIIVRKADGEPGEGVELARAKWLNDARFIASALAQRAGPGMVAEVLDGEDDNALLIRAGFDGRTINCY